MWGIIQPRKMMAACGREEVMLCTDGEFYSLSLFHCYCFYYYYFVFFWSTVSPDRNGAMSLHHPGRHAHHSPGLQKVGWVMLDVLQPKRTLVAENDLKIEELDKLFCQHLYIYRKPKYISIGTLKANIFHRIS